MSIKDNYDSSNLLIQRSSFDKWSTLDELKVEESDDELLKMIKGWIWVASKSDSVLITEWEKNKRYYRGIDLRTNDITDDKSQVIDNRIFTNIETIVPLVTSKPAKPIVFIPMAQGKWKKWKNIRDQAIKNQKVLLSIYDDQKLQEQYEKMVRQQQIYRIWIVKYGIKDDKIFTKVLLPSRVLLDSEAIDIDDSDFIGEKIVSTASNLAKQYPNKKTEISSHVSWKMWTKLTYIEWWTDDMKIVSIWSTVILDKIKNPLFDYEWVSKTTYDENGKKIQETTKNNFFNKPKKPYIRFSIYNIGENIIDDVTPLVLSRTLQDNINDRKRQIADNVDVAGWPIRKYKWMSEDESDLANQNLKAWDGVNLWEEQDISYVQAALLSSDVQNDLNDSRNAIDNIFGIHSTTRGERLAAESWKAREALREWDEDRQATIWRAIEQVSEELYNAYAHLIKVFYDKEHLLPILWKDWSEDFVEFKRDDISDGMKIKVKPWSTIPDDPNALKAQALELLSAGKITARRAYEMMWMEDADEAAKELELEAVNAQVEQQKILQEQQKQQAVQKQATDFEQQIQQIQ